MTLLPTPPIDLEQAEKDARLVSILAWAQIAGYFRGAYEIFEKGPDGPATEADILADRFIVSWLAERYPRDSFGYMSEEAADTDARLDKPYCWIIDPIDGTRGFIDGLPDFAVQVGLVARDEDGLSRPVVGIVYQPVPGLMYRAATGFGAWRENLQEGITDRLQVSSVSSPEASNLVVTRSNMGRRLRSAMAAVNPASSYQSGSLGVKVAHVAEGRADLYLNTSRRFCKEWDTCAPHCLIEEAGGRLTDLKGLPLTYNKTNIYVEEGLVVSNGTLHDDVILRLAGVQELWAT